MTALALRLDTRTLDSPLHKQSSKLYCTIASVLAQLLRATLPTRKESHRLNAEQNSHLDQGALLRVAPDYPATCKQRSYGRVGRERQSAAHERMPKHRPCLKGMFTQILSSIRTKGCMLLLCTKGIFIWSKLPK